MTRIEPSRLSALLLDTPAWARLGLAVRDPALRARAADAIAGDIAARIDAPPPPDRDQLALPL